MNSQRMLIVVAIPVGVCWGLEKKKKKWPNQRLILQRGILARRHCVFVFMNRGWKYFSMQLHSWTHWPAGFNVFSTPDGAGQITVSGSNRSLGLVERNHLLGSSSENYVPSRAFFCLYSHRRYKRWSEVSWPTLSLVMSRLHNKHQRCVFFLHFPQVFGTAL